MLSEPLAVTPGVPLNRVARVERFARITWRTIASRASPLRAKLQPRRLHAYCVSAPRSGTHSIAGLFSTSFRAAHEPDTDLLYDAIRSHTAGTLDTAALRRWLEWRDRALWLEMEAHNRLGHVAGLLAETFLQSRFVLVVRDCYSWLESYLSLQLASRAAGESRRAREVRDWQFGVGRFTHGPGERVLADLGLHTLDGYLSFWAESNRRVIEAVPAERLLSLRLDRLDQAYGDVARFLGVPAETLDRSRGHLDHRSAKSGLIFGLDREYLEERVERHCRPIMRRFFPEIAHLDDAVGAPQATS